MLRIGTIIKELRTKNQFTQDALASAIGVMPQTISRWETEGGYPDMDLLPLIADFFSVSMDELLGYRRSERKERLEQIRKEMSRLAGDGTLEERIAYGRYALAEYPADYGFRVNLAVCLYHEFCRDRNQAVLEEAESLALYVVEHCKEEEIHYNAINVLINMYADTKNTDKALDMVNRLPLMKYCRESAKACGIGDGKTEQYRQEEIDMLTDFLGTAITSLAADSDLPDDAAAWDKRIRMLEISNALYRMIYGENLLFYHNRLAYNYLTMSTFQIAQGKREEALASLEEMCRHAVAYTRAYENSHGKYYTSILADKLIYAEPGRDIHEVTDHSQCWYLLNRMQENRYDGIRKEERFGQIGETLREYAW